MSQKIFCSLAYLFLLLRILLILNYTLKNFSLIKNKLRDRDQAEFLRSFKNNMINKILAPDTNTVRFFVFMVTYFVVSYRCLSQYYATEGKNWLKNSCTIVFVSWVTCSMFNDGMDAWQVHLNIDKLYSSVPIFSLWELVAWMLLHSCDLFHTYVCEHWRIFLCILSHLLRQGWWMLKLFHPRYNYTQHRKCL